jgi:hypothetical protein
MDTPETRMNTKQLASPVERENKRRKEQSMGVNMIDEGHWQR